MNYYEREEHYTRMKREREDKIRDKVDSKYKKECTFKPKIKNAGRKPSFSNFLKRQNEFLLNKEKNYREKMNDKYTKEVVLAPTKPHTARSSSSTAKDLIRNFILAGDIKERNDILSTGNSKVQNARDISPINLYSKRGKNRESVKSDKDEKMETQLKKGNERNDFYIRKLFEKEFAQHTKKIPKDNISYKEFQAILKNFGCITSKGEEGLVQELWIKLEDQATISKETLKNAMKAIFKIPFIHSRSKSIYATEKGMSKEYSNKFRVFRLNKQRLFQALSSHRTKEEVHSFVPSICKKSSKLAITARNRLKGKSLNNQYRLLYRRTVTLSTPREGRIENTEEDD